MDDAVHTGTITFQNKALYERICSAHKTADYRNMESLANHRVWIPFHFLPGNGGKNAQEDPDQKFVEKIVCKKDSPIARDMLKACIQDRNKAFGLHRLGITMHVYADTWAHQGFAGINDEANDIIDLTDESDSGLDSQGMLSRFFGKLFDRAASKLVGDVLPLGHGAALCFPDLPYLKWSYKDKTGKRVDRNNTLEFLEAADKMCRAMQRYRANDHEAPVTGLGSDYKKTMEGLFRTLLDEEGNDRHARWMAAIRDGIFPFDPISLEYHAEGKKSWKGQVLGTSKYASAYPWDKSFLASDWKCFHDALMDHRFSLLHDILPRYGICAA